MDLPVDHDDRVYLVERHVTSKAEFDGLAAEYDAAQRDVWAARDPATLRSADDLVRRKDRRA
jgi:hypothetical protein